MTGGGERGEKPAGRPSVRTARVGDAEAIAAIGSIGFPAVHDDIVGEEFAAAVVEQTYSLGALRECITLCAAADDAEFLVAEGDGDVLGYVHYDSEGAEAELHRIYVDASRKRSGVGSALMEELHRRLSPGATYVLLVAAANGARSRRAGRPSAPPVSATRRRSPRSAASGFGLFTTTSSARSSPLRSSTGRSTGTAGTAARWQSRPRHRPGPSPGS